MMYDWLPGSATVSSTPHVIHRFLGSWVDVLGSKALVAAAGPDWPDLKGLDPETQALPPAVINVQHGLGFLGGVISTEVWWPGYDPRPEPSCW